MEILLNDNGDGGEFVLDGGDLKADNTFYTAVYLSLFNGDAFYNVFELYPTDNDFEESLSLPITLSNLQTVENNANKALKWMLDLGIADSIEVSATGDLNEKINVQIIITEPDGDSYQYYITWENEKAILKVS